MERKQLQLLLIDFAMALLTAILAWSLVSGPTYNPAFAIEYWALLGSGIIILAMFNYLAKDMSKFWSHVVVYAGSAAFFMGMILALSKLVQ